MEVIKEDKNFQYVHQQPKRFFWLKRMAYPFVNLFFHLLVSVIPSKQRRTKYFFSLVLIFKNEAPYLKEWLEYHIMLGIDHFYLYQNNSTDNYLDIVQSYIDRGVITLIDWPDYPGQYSAYLNWYKTYRQETHWVSFIDADEFLCPLSDSSLSEVMRRYKRFPVVLVYWKLFGTSGQLKHNQDKLVIEQYISCRPKLFTEGKVIYNTRFDAASGLISMHGLETRWCGIKIPPMNTFKKFVIWDFHRVNRHKQAVIQLNHYWSKAFDCWQQKYEKGSIEKGTKYKDYDFFKQLELACTSADFTIWRYVTLLKQKLKE